MTDRLQLNDDVSSVKGIGAKKAVRLEQLGIITVRDMLDHLPVRYKDKRQVVSSRRFGEDAVVQALGTLINKRSRRISQGRSLLELSFQDDDGFFYASFFNMPFLERSLKKGSTYLLYGKVQLRNGLKLFTNPEIKESDGDGKDLKIEPVYRCTSGITSRELGRWNEYILENAELHDWLSDELVEKRKLCDLRYAYNNIHFPLDNNRYKIALYRLVYDQLLSYQIAIRKNRAILSDDSLDTSIEDADISPFISDLPFELTDGQKDSIRDIEADLLSSKPMNRLVQGDVGSGKTVVAEVAIYKVISAGRQAAFMAPTEILARQHFNKLSKELSRYEIDVALLISGLKAAERRNILERLKNGDIDLLIGTHALIQDDVEFKDLALVITDEQHRFGVNQRKALSRKGATNVLVMSATPIPRTLAATVFGDMDFSVIKSMPKGRIPITTRSIDKSSRERAYQAIKKELEEGNQAYLVAPAIEQDEDADMASAEAMYQEMRKRFRGFNVEMIHGRMDKDSKERIMSEFAAGEIDLLVSTVVIEVGIDVPNATIMVIENADRFGLAQLHQLRGRVGRSDKRSYCYLINYSKQESAKERMRVMSEMSDGFSISEADYELRGAGDIMGTMQHGFVKGRIFSLFKYEEILIRAGEDAEDIIKDSSLCDENELDVRISSIYTSDNSEVL